MTSCGPTLREEGEGCRPPPFPEIIGFSVHPQAWQKPYFSPCNNSMVCTTKGYTRCWVAQSLIQSLASGAPEGNGCAERFVRILKENLLWVRTFRTVEELRQALLEFKRTYNENGIIQRHSYKTPAQLRLEQSQALPLAA